VQVHCDEGIASHIGPEPCAGIREEVGEASAGVRAGQPLSRDRKLILGADAVCVAEGNASACVIASTWVTRRGRRTWHARTLLAREPGDLQLDRRGGMRRRPASGRRGAEADDVRAGEVTLTGSTDEVGEQHGCTRGGVDGGKRWDREECGTAKHGPDSVPAQLCPKRTPAHAAPFTAARRHLLAIRTVCGNSARTDLCGGCPVMGIPTAILDPERTVAVLRSRGSEDHVEWRSRRVAPMLRSTWNDPSLDHFVCPQQHRLRDRDANRSRRFQIHGQLHPAERLHR
jgi:hypothetical protein